MTYIEVTELLDNYTWSAGKNGLEMTLELLHSFDDPHKSLKYVHVAGTNGKGSVCAMTESVLRNAGYKTGMYISPHVEDIRERYQINSEKISEEDFAKVILRVIRRVEELQLSPSQYIIMTVAAFLYFADKNCDIVILEAGLGGLLDSTNVIDTSEVSVICNIGLDHTEQLGDTVEKIAAVKCGIIKEGSAVACYDNRPSVMEVIFTKARANSCRVYPSREEVLKYVPALKGAYQKKNALVVMAVIHALKDRGWKIDEKAVETGFRTVFWPARFEFLGTEPLFILDGGHNSQCAEAIVEALEELIPEEKVVFLMGMLRDKDVDSTLDVICTRADRVVCLTPDSHRALSANELAEKIRARGVHSDVIPDGGDMIIRGIACAVQTGRTVVAFGSLYLAGDIRKVYTQQMSNNGVNL